MLDWWGSITVSEGTQKSMLDSPAFTGLTGWRSLEMDTAGNVYGLLSGGKVISAASPSASLGPNLGIEIAQSLTLANGGLAVLDGFGAVYTSHGAPNASDLPSFNWDIARDIEYATAQNAYYVLSGFGTLHTNAPELKFDAPNFGWDIAVDLELFPDGEGGYILDGFGGVTVLGNAPDVVTPYFGWNIARSMQISPDARGIYIMDGYGNVFTCGEAKPVSSTPSSAPVLVDFVLR